MAEEKKGIFGGNKSNNEVKDNVVNNAVSSQEKGFDFSTLISDDELVDYSDFRTWEIEGSVQSVNKTSETTEGSRYTVDIPSYINGVSDIQKIYLISKKPEEEIMKLVGHKVKFLDIKGNKEQGFRPSEGVDEPIQFLCYGFEDIGLADDGFNADDLIVDNESRYFKKSGYVVGQIGSINEQKDFRGSKGNVLISLYYRDKKTNQTKTFSIFGDMDITFLKQAYIQRVAISSSKSWVKIHDVRHTVVNGKSGWWTMRTSGDNFENV